MSNQQTCRTHNSSQRYNVSWGGGKSSLFIRINEQGNFDLLDYQYNHQALHQEFGGKNYYQNYSGSSGAGYLETIGDLIPVGFYRADTKWPICFPKEIGEAWELMLPYHKHQQDKREVLEKNPVVLRRGDQILFVRYKELRNVLLKLLDREFKDGINHFSDKCQLVTRIFTGKEVIFRFYDLYTYGDVNLQRKALTFMTHLIPNEAIVESLCRLNQLFRFTEENGRIFETIQINGQIYKGDYLEESPLNNHNFLPSGWEPIGKGAAFKRFGTEIKLVYWKKISELAKDFPKSFIPEEEQEDFYFVELEFPNVIFQMNWDKYLKQVQNDIKENFYTFYSQLLLKEDEKNEN